MTLHSFWLAAAARPDALALVEPDGTEHTAGALLAQCNRTVSGLRALGLVAGDAVAVMLGNGAPLIELALACGQAGLYLTPINTQLTATEVKFILDRPFGLDDPLGRAVRDLFRSGRLPGVLLVDPRAVRRAPG